MSELETVGPQETEPAQADTLDSILADAIKAAEPEADAGTDTQERERDERGRFKAKDSDSAEPEPSQAEPAPDEAKPAEDQGDAPAEQPQPLQPPERWSEVDKAAFAKLPPDAQAMVLERNKAMEGDYTRKTQELAETRKQIEPLLSSVSQWSPYLQSLNVTPEQAFQQMLATEYTLRTGTPEQRQQALAYLAELYAVPLPQSSAGNDGENLQPDPHVQQLRHELSSLKQLLAQRDVESRARERQQAELEFESVGRAKDESGNAKYPHWDRVKASVVQLVATGQADSWDAAYQKAVRLDDDLYKQIVEAERKRALEAAEKERQAALEKAKQAKPLKTSPAMPKGATAARDLDAILSEQITRAGIL